MSPVAPVVTPMSANASVLVSLVVLLFVRSAIADSTATGGPLSSVLVTECTAAREGCVIKVSVATGVVRAAGLAVSVSTACQSFKGFVRPGTWGSTPR